MKTFISVINEEKKQTNGGRKITESIYRMVQNTPHYIGEVEYNTALYKGRPSVVMNKISELEAIPKIYKQGYYENGIKGFKIINL